MRAHMFVFFFLKNRPPPDSPLLPLPAPFPTSSHPHHRRHRLRRRTRCAERSRCSTTSHRRDSPGSHQRSEEHTSELQSRLHIVCRLLLEKKKEQSHTPYAGVHMSVATLVARLD